MIPGALACEVCGFDFPDRYRGLHGVSPIALQAGAARNASLWTHVDRATVVTKMSASASKLFYSSAATAERHPASSPQ